MFCFSSSEKRSGSPQFSIRFHLNLKISFNISIKFICSLSLIKSDIPQGNVLGPFQLPMRLYLDSKIQFSVSGRFLFSAGNRVPQENIRGPQTFNCISRYTLIFLGPFCPHKVMNFLRETKPNLFIRYKVKCFFAAFDKMWSSSGKHTWSTKLSFRPHSDIKIDFSI